MDDEAIRKDVSEDQLNQQSAEAQQTEAESHKQAAPDYGDPVSRRAARMQEAAEKRAELREEERRAMARINNPDLVEPDSLDQGAEGSDPIPQSTSGTSEDASDFSPAREERQPRGEEPRGWVTRDDGQRVKRLKVNGEIREVTEEEYDRMLSKELAGDQKLELANRMAQQLRQREQQLAQREQALRMPPPQPGVSDQELQQALDEYHNAVYEGDTDAAREKLMRVMQAGRQSSTPNLDALAEEAANRASQRIVQRQRQTSMQEGWSRFQQDYPEIVSHPGRLAYADTHLKTVRELHPDWAPAQQILEAGRRTAEELGLKVTPQVNTDAASREERKRKLQSVPKPGTTARRPNTRQEPDMSPAAKIARMRAGRAVAR